MFYIELIFAKIIAFLVNLINCERGTNFAGKILLKIDKKFLRKFKIEDYSKIVFITGTNGKSTTTNLIHHILTKSGYKVASNLKGSNMLPGVTTCLIKDSNIKGIPRSDFLILEIDERFLRIIYKELPAKNVVVTNVQTDQVRRNANYEFIYNMIDGVLKEDMTLFLNGDEPRSKSYEDNSKNVIYYGCERLDTATEKNDFLAVTMPCPKCFGKIKFDYYNLGNTGKFHCTKCNFKSADKLKYITQDVDFDKGTFKILGQTFYMPYETNFMQYNYSVAVAVCHKLGLDLETISAAFNDFTNVKGRMETLKFRNKKINYIRFKQENPETMQGVLDVIASDKKEKVLILGLGTVYDYVPYYTNTFYSYDCDFSDMLNSNVKKIICVDKNVCYDTANRLLYAGFPKEKIEILPTDNYEEIINATLECGCDNVYLVTLMKIFEKYRQYINEANGGNKNGN